MNRQLKPNDMETNYANDAKAGTLGGTLFILLVKINFSELLSTAILAAVGAFVSFSVSILMKWGIKKLRKVKKPV